MAQEATHLPRHVVMVNMKPVYLAVLGGSTGLSRAANPATIMAETFYDVAVTLAISALAELAHLETRFDAPAIPESYVRSCGAIQFS